MLTGKVDHAGFTGYEKLVIEFITNWLQGKKEFHFATSGSTGKPKTIAAPRELLELSAHRTNNYFKIDSTDTILVCLDVKRIGGFMMLLRGLLGNSDLIIQEPSARPFEQLSISQSPTFISLVPNQLYHSIGHLRNDERWQKLKAILVGGAPLDHTLESTVLDLEVPVYQTFGMTETFSHIALKCINGPGRSTNYQLLEGWQIKVDGENRLSVRFSEDSLSGWIRTNDVVRITSDRQFEWLGRFDNIINSGGIKIHPEIVEAEVQTIFSRHQLHSRFFASSVADKELGERVILFIETDREPEFANQLKQELTNKLPQYWAPKEIHCMPRFLATDNGKIRRSATRDHFYLKR